MSSSNCCFLTCIQISQEAGQVVWYSHLSKNFPQFVVIHTVKGFGIVNKAEVDSFLELSFFPFFFFNSLLVIAFKKHICILGECHQLLRPDWNYCIGFTSVQRGEKLYFKTQNTLREEIQALATVSCRRMHKNTLECSRTGFHVKWNTFFFLYLVVAERLTHKGNI